MQKLTGDSKTILLLCGRFGKSSETGSAKPLSLGEYNRLADWMKDRRFRPADLLAGLSGDGAYGQQAGVDADRIRALLSRGAAMALAVEKWTHNGIWIVCRSDAHYPDRLKKHLKKQAPPVLFGVGDMNLLTSGGLAVVGSRNVDAKGEAYTRAVAEESAKCGLPIVSGGARGVDQIAMLSALESGGKVLGVLADALQKASLAGKYRNGIREKRLVLVSPFHPEARFNVGNAMGRNKYIYALSDFALVISAEVEKGGTWAGAKEELKRQDSRPVFVRMEEDTPEGNRALMQFGAMPFPQQPWKEDLSEILKNAPPIERLRAAMQASLFREPAASAAEIFVKEKPARYAAPSESATTKDYAEVPVDKKSPRSIYDAVLPLLLNAIRDWKSAKDIAEELDVRLGQINDWLKQAVKEGRVEKKNKPVSFRRT